MSDSRIDLRETEPTEPTGPDGVAPSGSSRAVSGERFSATVRQRALDIVARFPADRSRSALLPMLHLVQSEEGYVSPAGIGFCAEVLGLTRAEVGAVVTFYTMYKRRPTGDWLVSVCTNTMCDVLGGRRVFEMVSEYLDAGHNETTADGKFTLEHAECLAACDYGPVLTVNYEFFDKVDVESALGIVTRLQAGERPAPSRGARLCTLKEMSLQLAGFLDGRPGALADGVAGDATLRGNRLAEEHGVAVADFDPDTPIAKPKPKAEPAKAEPAKAPPKAEPAKAGPAKAEPAKAEPPTVESAQAEPPAGDAPDANKPASDGKPAGDGPLPQEQKLKEAT